MNDQFRTVNTSVSKWMMRVGWLFTLSSLIWLAVGGLFTLDTMRFLPGTLSANGTIIHCDYSIVVQHVNSNVHVNNNNGQSYTCDPTVSFATQSGQRVTITTSSSSSTYHAGDAVSVRYHPNDPQDARIDDFFTMWGGLLIGGFGFLIFLFVGLFALIRGPGIFRMPEVPDQYRYGR